MLSLAISAEDLTIFVYFYLGIILYGFGLSSLFSLLIFDMLFKRVAAVLFCGSVLMPF
jgi:hypothetical protein